MRPLLLLLACASSACLYPLYACASTTGVPKPRERAPELAPFPVTVEELKAASKPGRTWTWKVTEDGKPESSYEIRFTAVAGDTATICSGPAGAANDCADATFAELQQHASFPKNSTTIEEKEVTVPAGTFLCKWYTVRRDDGRVQHFCFVVKEPGPPFYFDAYSTGPEGDKLLMKQELVSFTPGS